MTETEQLMYFRGLYVTNEIAIENLHTNLEYHIDNLSGYIRDISQSYHHMDKGKDEFEGIVIMAELSLKQVYEFYVELLNNTQKQKELGKKAKMLSGKGVPLSENKYLNP